MLALRAVNLDFADEEAGLRAAFDKFDANRSASSRQPNPNPNPNEPLTLTLPPTPTPTHYP